MEAKKNRLSFEVSLLHYLPLSPPSSAYTHRHTRTQKHYSRTLAHSLSVCSCVPSFRKKISTIQNKTQYNLMVAIAVFVVCITAVVYFYLLPYQIFDCWLYTCVDSILNYSTTVYSKWWASTTILYRLSRILYIVHIILVCHPIWCCYHSILEKSNFNKSQNFRIKKVISNWFDLIYILLYIWSKKQRTQISLQNSWLWFISFVNFLFQGPSCFMLDAGQLIHNHVDERKNRLVYRMGAIM